MNFADPAFILLFLPVVAALFFFPPLRRWRVPLLVLTSLAFYETAAGLRQTLLLIGLSAWVWLIAGWRDFPRHRWALCLALLPPLGALAYLKYADFIASTFAAAGAVQTATALIPAGISFYVFHLATFAVDRFRGDWKPVPPPLQFGVYVAFFPQLVAGPITRIHQVASSIAGLPAFRLDAERAQMAIGYACVGLACKTLLADPLGRTIQPLIDSPGELTFVPALFLVLGYSFRIYFDFYGYSLIALGLGALFGITLPANFDRPYRALNPREFWRRWHITLSFAIRDYLYKPLGGNRRYVRNILIAFAACGLWHGAGWNFVAWGLYHGLLVILYKFTRPHWDRMPVPVQVAATFTLVSLGWLLFIFDLGTAMQVLRSFAVPGPGPAIALSQWGLLMAAALAAFAVDTDRLAAGFHQRWPLLRGGVFAGLLIVGLLLLEGAQPFIYFRF